MVYQLARKNVYITGVKNGTTKKMWKRSFQQIKRITQNLIKVIQETSQSRNLRVATPEL